MLNSEILLYILPDIVVYFNIHIEDHFFYQ